LGLQLGLELLRLQAGCTERPLGRTLEERLLERRPVAKQADTHSGVQ
jgi:hypothetical protein